MEEYMKLIHSISLCVPWSEDCKGRWHFNKNWMQITTEQCVLNRTERRVTSAWCHNLIMYRIDCLVFANSLNPQLNWILHLWIGHWSLCFYLTPNHPLFFYSFTLSLTLPRLVFFRNIPGYNLSLFCIKL